METTSLPSGVCVFACCALRLIGLVKAGNNLNVTRLGGCRFQVFPIYFLANCCCCCCCDLNVKTHFSSPFFLVRKKRNEGKRRTFGSISVR